MSTSKAKGTAFESGVVKALHGGGFLHAERRALAGTLDKGDVILGPRYVIECKAAKKIELAEWSKETLQEKVNAGADYGILVIKRPRKSIADAYAVMPLSEMIQMLAEVEHLTPHKGKVA